MKTSETTLEGTLNPIEWDEDGEVIKFSVYSDDEEDYIVENYPKPKKLQRLLNKRVLVQGKIGANAYGEKVIYATKMKQIKRPLRRASFRSEVPVFFWDEEFPAHIPKEAALFGQQTPESFWEAG